MKAGTAKVALAAGALLSALACASTSETDPAMERHFGRALEVRTATLFGRVAEARDAGASLRLEQPPAWLPPVSDPYFADFYAAAEAISEVQDREDLPALAAELTLRCGSCHTAHDAGPIFAVGSPRPADDLESHMLVYAWGAARMWEGIIGGSTTAWRAGAEAIRDDPIADAEFLDRAEDARVATERASMVQRVAQRALRVSAPEARAGVLAELWTSCADCHEQVGIR